jgi:hypothetical protein
VGKLRIISTRTTRLYPSLYSFFSFFLCSCTRIGVIEVKNIRNRVLVDPVLGLENNLKIPTTSVGNSRDIQKYFGFVVDAAQYGS